MREIRFWYRPNVDFIAIRITEQNPCGCHPNDVIMETQVVGMRKHIGSFTFDPKIQSLDQYMASAAWEELR